MDEVYKYSASLFCLQFTNDTHDYYTLSQLAFPPIFTARSSFLYNIGYVKEVDFSFLQNCVLVKFLCSILFSVY